MPRKYTRKLGSCAYRNYSEAHLAEAVKMVLDKQLSLREASERYNIHRNTIWLKTKDARGTADKPVRTPGGQPIFTAEEEHRFVAHAIAMSTFGFPITTFDMRCVVKAYLDRTGRNVPVYKNNFPGRDWAESFIRRHNAVISQRTAKNITYARAVTDEKIIDTFFSNLEKEIDGVPPHNVWNYDETNLVDDPGNKKVITRRGAKYPEQIQNASKACTSIMVSGNAAGDLVPLYVNYKAEKLWTTWTENGPDGARYNRTKSGWFDHQVFEDWFISLMLPILKRQEGTKVVIGDNLSSHISLEVLRFCEENSIKFIALPPNATHLLQPLDVAFFRPLKTHWREVLTNWKKTPSGSRCSTIPKDEFPRLLKQLLTAMEWGTRQNLQSGFRKTGIVPLNKQQVLSRLPSKVLEQSLASMTTCIGDTFLEELKRRREEATKPHENKRRKKVNVPPGKSIGTSDVLDKTNASAGIKKTKQKAPQLSRKQRKRSSEETEDESDDSDAFSLQDSDLSVNFDEELSDESDNSLKLLLPETSSAHLENIDLRVGEYVVVNYEGTLFPGRVTETKSNGYMVTVMEITKKQWKWPTKPDEILYSKEEVLYSIYPPKQISSRGLFQVSGLH